MTAAQQRAINRRNALKSTGPITAEGKERTRQNAIKHGLCATELALPIENADALQAEFDRWVDHYQPVGPAEFALVEDIVKSQLRLRRCAGRETAVVASQVRSVQEDWDNQQEDRRASLETLLATDPATAVRELERFGTGRRWLLERWRYLGQWFLHDGFCASPELEDEAVHLLGIPATNLKAGPGIGFKFKLCCTLGRPNPDRNYARWLLCDAGIHPEYRAELGGTVPEPEACRAAVRMIVAEQIKALEKEEAAGLPGERAEADGAAARVQLPGDSPDNRLALRYETTARAALDKARKALECLQAERFALEAEFADLPDVVTLADSPPVPVLPLAPNEAGPPSETRSSSDSQTSYDS